MYIRFNMCVLLNVYHFPCGFLSRGMWYSNVIVLDHCLSFYFASEAIA